MLDEFTMSRPSAASARESEVGRHSAPGTWHVITCEYPPQVGGVSDYTYWVTSGLAAAGDEVHVWCPVSNGSAPQVKGVVLHPELGQSKPSDLRRIGEQLDRFPAPRRILVQWVPHGYGYKSMNVLFCWWLWNRSARNGDKVEIMLHEPSLGFSLRSWRQNAAALVHRLMAMILLRAAEHVWMSIPHWERRWRPYALGRNVPFQWLPIPSNIPIHHEPARVHTLRQRYLAGKGLIIGHFGTYGWPITSLLDPILTALTASGEDPAILLLGSGSREFYQKLIAKQPQLAGRVQATGALSAEDLSCHVSACDLLIQPYPDGASTRRTSLMVGLSHGKPLVTTMGPLSESFWSETGALLLAPAGDIESFLGLVRQLLADGEERARIGAAAQRLYQDRFDISYTVAALRAAPQSVESTVCAS